jgi:predicted nucleic acid-binding protein
VAALFFDTSAIAKRYSNETGSAWVIEVTEPTAGNTIYLARVTEVEVVSAIMRRTRDGALSAPDAAMGIRTFRYDFGYHYRIIEISAELTDRAVSMVRAHSLRAYDAVQLAAALEINQGRSASGLPAITLVSADNSLNAAAVAEGLAVEDPNAHP